jgi:hypothetical protein
LRLAEGALKSIRREVKPKVEAKYQLMAEAYIDQTADLHAEIAAYRDRGANFTPLDDPVSSRD